MAFTVIIGPFLLALLSSAEAQPAISEARVEPAVVAPGGEYLVSCRPAAPAGLKAVTVELLHGGWITVYPRLYDDGTHGDARANDGVYSLRLKAPDRPGTVIVVISVADAQGREVDSEPLVLTVR